MADEGWQLTPPTYKPPEDISLQRVPPPAPPVVPAQPEQPKEFIGLPVRASGDRVFLLKGGKKFWIMNPEAYARLGFKFGDEVRVDEATLAALAEGTPIQ